MLATLYQELESFSLLGNDGTAWLTALSTFTSVFVVLMMIRWFACRRLGSAPDGGHESAWRHNLRVVLTATQWWLLLIVAVHASSLSLTLTPRMAAALKATAAIAVLIQGGLWSTAALRMFTDRWMRRRIESDPTRAPLMTIVGYGGRVALWSLVFLLILQNMGIEITALLTGLGIGGVAIALAVQNILGDLFASLSILVDKPFVIGDSIVVDNLSGTVENIGLKTTRVRSVDGEQLVFPNSDLLQSRIRNYKRMDRRRALFQFVIPLETPIEHVRSIPAMVRDIIAAQPNVQLDRAHLQGFNESGINFEVVYYLTDARFNFYMDVQQEIYLQVLEQLQKLDIEIGRPSRTLFVRDVDPEEGGGDEDDVGRSTLHKNGGGRDEREGSPVKPRRNGRPLTGN